MSKHSNEFKQEVVEFYLNNNGEDETRENYFNIPSFSTVRKRVNKI